MGFKNDDMSKEEQEQVVTMINTLGYYQSHEAVKNWFKWSDGLTSKNIKACLGIINN